MAQKRRKKKHVKSRKKRYRLLIFKRICNILLGGVTLGLAASLIVVLLPRILPFNNKPLKEKTAAVYDYITVSRANATPLSGKNDNARTAPDTLRLLEDKEVEETLAQLARENEDIAGIYAERAKYPEELLAALAANRSEERRVGKEC